MDRPQVGSSDSGGTTASAPEPAWLIVNADDYGYFDCVSRGILHAATNGIVTATGVFANAPGLDEHARWLRDCDGLDAGVHLNLTDREPLTSDMRKCLARWGGRFPGKFAIAGAVLSGGVPVAAVRAEWRAQIERCLTAGITVRFLNSHEHAHMLPRLFQVAAALAKEHGIRHVRFATARLREAASAGGWARSAIMTALGRLSRRRDTGPHVGFLGLERSGRVDLGYLRRVTDGLAPGSVHELMCHPGYLDPVEVSSLRLLGYHDWDGELTTLTSAAARELLEQRGIRLVGYRDLEIAQGRLRVRRDVVRG